MSLSPGGPDLAPLSSLDDPLRRRLYEVVTSRPGPVSRDEAASAAGIGRALAVYHLDKLVESGLLTASYQRPPGRSGPGPAVPPSCTPGRTASSRSPCRRGSTNWPHGCSSRRSRPIRATAAGLRWPRRRAGWAPSWAQHSGRPQAADPPDGRDAAKRDVKGVLTQHGYEPCRGTDGVIRLRNCPFHQLTEQHREVVCGMNLALVEGLVDGPRRGRLASGSRPAARSLLRRYRR